MNINRIVITLATALAAITTLSHAATLTVDTTKDAPILNVSGYTTDNFGGHAELQTGYVTAGGNNGPQHGLLGFDISSLSSDWDNVESVDSVTLRLHVAATDHLNGDLTLGAYTLIDANTDWVEGTGTSANDTSGVTWNYKDQSTSTAWDSGIGFAASDYNATELASVDFSSTSKPAVDSTIDFNLGNTDLYTLLDGWLDNSGKGTVMLMGTAGAGSTNRMKWHSLQETTSGTGAYVPELIINYTIPEPASLALLGLGVTILLGRCRRRV